MQLLAHRGLTGPSRPENTADAVAAALAHGADGSEVDLRLSADGVLLAAHDDDLSRVAGVDLRVSRSRACVVRALTLPGGTRVARLPELVEAGSGGRLVLELKHPAAGPVEHTVLALAGELKSLRRQGRGLDVTVSSFSPTLVAGVRARELGVRTALLGERLVPPRDLVEQAVAAGHDEVHPHVAALRADPGAIALARGHGLAVVPWTVNLPSDARRLAALAGNGLISDDPVLLRRSLAGAPRAGRPVLVGTERRAG